VEPARLSEQCDASRERTGQVNRFTLILVVAAFLASGCSREKPDPPPSRAATLRAVAAVDESTLVAHGGVTIELPEGRHRDLVKANCTVCHSPALIMQQRLTRADWDKTITWMQEKQNLGKLEPQVRRAILDYLVAQYGAVGGEDENAEPVYLPNPVW
jgi:cytochrome c5